MYEPPEEPTYRTYRSAPRGLVARLRGESDSEQLEARAEKLSREAPPAGGRGGADRGGDARGGGGRGGDGRGGDGWDGHGAGGRGASRPPAARRRLFSRRAGLPRRPRFHPVRIIKYVVSFVIFWVVLSAVLFFVSASQDAGNLPGGSATEAALSSSGPMLISPSTVLILGLDNRPNTGYSSKEAGSNYNEAAANTDSIMLWRIGGGVSRRLSIPRDTLVDIPGLGNAKINAAWSFGGPKATIRVIENLTGVKINHMVVVDLGNFPKFIDDIGGVTVNTPKICSVISGGAKNGGFSLYLSRGSHHLDGINALTLARTRENRCNAAYNDFNRQAMQQKIMNAIKSQLFSLHAFIHLPWAAWDAPKVIQTDMGPTDLMQLFVSAEIGGSSSPQLLKEIGSVYNGADVQLPNAANIRKQVNKLMTGS